MPIEIDVDERLRDIGAVTLELADELGVEAISYRAIAKAMGGSTKLVTKYLPTRAELLLNAVRIAMENWRSESDQVLAEAASDERLRALAHWSCTTGAGDLAIRKLMVEVMSTHAVPHEVEQVLSGIAHTHREALLEAATIDRYEDPEAVVDAIFLATYGYFISTLRDLGAWPADRAAAAIDVVLDNAPRRRRSPRRRGAR